MFCARRAYHRAAETAYRSYVTDALNNIPQGRYMKTRYIDVIGGDRPEDIDVEAIISHIEDALGGE